MGRKKKQVIQEEELTVNPKEVVEETKVEELEVKEEETSKVATKSSFTYTGKVTVTIKKGDKPYFTKTYKNSGRWPLFKFFDYCLRGEFTVAEGLRPKFVDLFYLVNEGGVVPYITDEPLTPPPYHTLNQFYTNGDMTRVSLTSYPYLTTPAMKEQDNTNTAGIGYNSITYKFNIPFTQLAATDNGINLICLYGKNNQGIYDNPSCFFFIDDGNGNLGNLVADLIQPDMKLSDFSLYLEWELCVGNNNQ